MIKIIISSIIMSFALIFALEIYSSNLGKFYLDINFCDTGAAKITKINNEKLNDASQFLSREFSIKNLIRRLVYNLKKNK